MNTQYVVKSGGKRGAQYYEHRAIWAQAYGDIPPGHHVHHINGDKKDNRLENLELVSAFNHHQHHFKELAARPESKERAAENFRKFHASKPTKQKDCLRCGKTFLAKEHNQHGFTDYCTHKCRSAAAYHKKKV